MVASSVKIDPSTLQILVNSLNKLQNLDGLVHDDTIWSFADAKMELTNLPETCQLLRPALLNVIDLLKQLEAAGDALKELTASCERKLKVLKTTLQPTFLHCGIQILPDDILMHIFDIIMEELDHTSEEVFSLSHVSSRFRSLALASPKLWTRVSQDMPPNVVNTCLKHSKQSLLTINIWGYGMEDAKKFLGRVVGHSSRWKNFRFSCGPFDLDTGSPLQLAQTMGNCNVPNLEVLDLYCCSQENCSLCREMDVLQTQEMPKLCSLYIRNSLPSLTSLPRSLSSINIRHLTIVVPSNWDIRSLANVLGPLVDLVELELTAFRSDSVNNPGIQDADISLPKLKRLRLLGIDLVSFSVWTRCCRAPRVEELDLHVGAEPVKEWLTAIPSDSFGSVKKLSFDHGRRASTRRSNDGAVDFWHLVGKFPRLEHLDLRAQSCTFDPVFRDRLSMNVPPLRSLSLSLAFLVTDLVYFADTLEDSGRWEQFKSYEVRRPRWVTKGESETILAGKEVKWYE